MKQHRVVENPNNHVANNEHAKYMPWSPHQNSHIGTNIRMINDTMQRTKGCKTLTSRSKVQEQGPDPSTWQTCTRAGSNHLQTI